MSRYNERLVFLLFCLYTQYKDMALSRQRNHAILRNQLIARSKLNRRKLGWIAKFWDRYVWDQQAEQAFEQARCGKQEHILDKLLDPRKCWLMMTHIEKLKTGEIKGLLVLEGQEYRGIELLTTEHEDFDLFYPNHKTGEAMLGDRSSPIVNKTLYRSYRKYEKIINKYMGMGDTARLTPMIDNDNPHGCVQNYKREFSKARKKELEK